ncbi:MAG: site-2 protease family protein [Terriglobales bacterium]
MPETTSSAPIALEWGQQPQPRVWVVPKMRERWWLYGLFFLLTLFSTMIVGARLQVNFLRQLPVFSLNEDTLSLFPIGWIARYPANLLMGLPFSLTLMGILFSHEMGHYLYARYYRVYATPPLFIPCPYLSLFGTLGAFIRIKSPIPSRAALFDIGIAGPIAGFIPACLALAYGLSLSRPIAGAPTPALQLGFPLAFDLAARVLHISAPLSTLSLHPIADAAWVGMFATALNLLPAGQLDGGHIISSISPRWHRGISLATVFVLVPLGKYLWMGWFIWAVLLALTVQHPRVPHYPDVSGRRRILAVCALLMLVLTFTPAPLKNGSGRDVWREAWPGIRSEGAQAAHFVRDEVRHLLHRK